ncbi:MAG: hypothetical protein ACRELV_01785 [Longimicrobiales bacterium]
MPAHFRLDGTPDRWTRTTPLAWLMLSLFIAILLLSVASPAMAIGLLLRVQSEIDHQVRRGPADPASAQAR